MLIDVVLPCLNEAAALPWVLARMPAGYRAIVADNGSDDGSSRIASCHGAMVVQVPQRGFGAACHGGLLAAASNVVDLVLGRRRPSARGAWPAHARLGNRAIAAAVRRRTGLQLHDLGPMRAARRAWLGELALADRRFGYPLEMVIRAAGAGWRIAELDVPYHPRTGRSKVTGTVRGTLRTVRDMSRVMAE